MPGSVPPSSGSTLRGAAGRKAAAATTHSVAAADLFADASLAWVHIDARHDYESVVADINAWAPKIAPGGWLSGDDYHDEWWPGVVRAISDTLPDAVPWGSIQWRWIKPD
jgi:hypothetical protein